MVMDYLAKRGKRRSQRPDMASRNGTCEVISIIRTEPFNWVAVAEYRYGTDTWVESITFRVTMDHSTTPATRMIRVTDTDYEDDRDRSLTIDRHDVRPMPRVILDFLLAGRW